MEPLKICSGRETFRYYPNINIMKVILISIFLIYNFQVFSQQSSNVQVEYQVFCDVYSPTKFFATLYANNEESIYLKKRKTAELWAERKNNTPPGAKVWGGTDPSEPYLKIDRIKKKMFFFDLIGANNFLVEDNYNEFNWEITAETKDILGYPCTKATTLYRGRNWIAWFSSEVPLSAGPWKLHGLPGLILEAYDANSKYTFKLIKLEFKKNDILNKDFSTLMETKNTKPISYPQFLNDTDELRDNLFMDGVNENPNATITKIEFAREGEELKFEWEE